MRIRTKITFMGIFLPLAPVLIVLALVTIERQGLSLKMNATIDAQTGNELSIIARNVYFFCQTQNDTAGRAGRAPVVQLPAEGTRSAQWTASQ